MVPVSKRRAAAKKPARKAAPAKRKAKPKPVASGQAIMMQPSAAIVSRPAATAMVRRLDWLRSEAVSQMHNPLGAIKTKREIIAEIESLPFQQRAREMGLDPSKISEKELAERIARSKRQIDERERQLKAANARS
jgi:hypothetical protein